jgi:hypothetical protein
LIEDTEELLREIQLSFWIDFTEDDIVQAETIGDLFDCVVRKGGGFHSPKCLTSVAFYRLRQALVDVSGSERRSFRPNSSLRTLMPWRVRRARWKALESQPRLILPSLQPHRWFVLALWPVAAAVAIGYLLALEGMPETSLAWCVALISGFLFTLMAWVALLLVTSPLHRSLPLRTVEDMVRYVVAHNHQKLAQEAGGTSTKAQAWAAFRELVGSSAGIHPWAVKREMRFPEDLRIE